MRMLRIGVIGVGGIAQARHLPTFANMTDQVKIQAVSDLNQELAGKIAKQYGVPVVVENYEDMFEHVDAVTICTPNKFHADIAIAALEAGKHVLCEKPMALSAREAERMVEASKRTGKVLFIGFHYRFMKESQAAKKVMDAGEIGKPLVVRVEALRRRKVPGWGVFINKELQGGGSLIDFGCHHLDLALWLLGNPQPVEVSGATYQDLSTSGELVNTWGDIDANSFEVDDHATAYIRFDNGATLFLETSWAANVADDKESVRISGDKAGIDVFPFAVYQSKHGLLLDQVPNWLPGPDDPSVLQAANFVDSCLGIQEAIVKPEQALQTSRIIDAIYESSISGKSVRF
ncbi:Gfo/Idh/MocA family oxidoreductase [Radiobacillus kanasensis]|uniref:Gfo/Idh/MocA family protein n=1 Tax=Radiobacillus kanasensis TaxID=2844358 RepID=UPI001E4D7EE3|nr:Gfo/Idh/MocA family oxidoreductase [Radiobacillus kanasensis]UFU01442.1 Gfo/Idh/MocA family oxidoreductase [Radiobacillus kanasensis]